MRGRSVLVVLLATLASFGRAQDARAQGNAAFPHARHARLFPLCTSCHAGVATEDAVRSFPSPTLCATCHNGTVKPRVAWNGAPPKEVGMLAFSHQRHRSATGTLDCASCHATESPAEWMHVARATPTRCFSCHEPRGAGHFSDASRCVTCHRPLATAASLSDARVAAIPKPPSHSASNFISAHGAAARANSASCATCHARESCQRCHVDGARQPLIRALGKDARVARLVANTPPSYPEPANHRSATFVLTHGAAARYNVAQCATCHARASCEACHTGDGARQVLRDLPGTSEATAAGVQLRHALPTSVNDYPPVTSAVSRPMPPLMLARVPQDTTRRVVRVHPNGFARAHGAQAASGASTCSACHAQRFCADCHTGERVTRRYHPANFVSTHAPQAYSRETDCSSCHTTEAFCRDCHRQAGLAATRNTRSTVFHDAQPLWLLQHGRAARQDMKSCTTCHQQTYCMQCHSDLGSRINPHGPGFDAVRMSSKNPQLCLYCHFKNPLAP